MHNVRSGCGWPSAGASRASGMFPRAPLSWKPRAETAQKSAIAGEIVSGEITGECTSSIISWGIYATNSFASGLR